MKRILIHLKINVELLTHKSIYLAGKERPFRGWFVCGNDKSVSDIPFIPHKGASRYSIHCSLMWINSKLAIFIKILYAAKF